MAMGLGFKVNEGCLLKGGVIGGHRVFVRV